MAEMAREHKDLDTISSYAWKICNDCTRTDLSLMYPPHQIAIGKFHFVYRKFVWFEIIK